MNRTLRVVLQVVAVSLLALLVGVFAKGLLDNATTVSAEVKDGKRPMAPNFTLVHDTNVVYHRWGVGGMPETFVIAPSGRVVKHFPGEITGADLDAELAPMLGGSGT